MGCACSRMSSNRVHPVRVAAREELSPPRRIFHSWKRDIQSPESTSYSPEEMWSRVDRRCQSVNRPRKSRDRTWKTVHIYVASTFSDFHAEREILATQVFPEIARWCGSVHMQLVPIDLRWGLSKELQTGDFIISALKEIDRCSEDGMPVFFIALISESLGWVPPPEHFPQSMADRYSLVQGMSLLEMEITRAAYTRNNANAAFLMRDPSRLSDFPPKHYRSIATPDKGDRLQLLKSKLRAKFPEQIFAYQCQVSHHGDDPKLDPSVFFQNAVTEFFINRIRKEFSLESGPMKLLSLQCEQQSQELERLCSSEMLGRDSVIEKITSYVDSEHSNSPLLLLGELGSGKSIVIAHCVQMYNEERQRKEKQHCQVDEKVQSPTNVKEDPRILSASTTLGKRWKSNVDSTQPITLEQEDDVSSIESIPLHGHFESLKPAIEPTDTTWHVFYHFVCSIPRSSELRHILQRIWAIEHLGEPKTSPMKTELNTLAKDVLRMFSQRGRKRHLIFIDGIDRVKDEYHYHVLKWIPARLPENIRIVITLSPSGETRKVLNSRDPKCIEVHCGPLYLTLSRQIISQSLSSHGLACSPQLAEVLLNKLSVCNPLFVVEACTELACVGSSSDLHEVAERIPDDLTGLYNLSIGRLEDEIGGRVAIAALCLLECSRYGLQEGELLDMLGALTPSGYSSASSNNPSRGITPSSAKHGASGSPHPQSAHLYQQPEWDTTSPIHRLHQTESSVYPISPHASQPLLRSHHVPDFDDYRDVESAGHKVSSWSQEARKSSPGHILILPGTFVHDGKLSPKSAKRHSYTNVSVTAVELTANPSSIQPITMSPSTSIANLRKPHILPPSPSLSLLSAELARSIGKSSSPSSQGGDSDAQAEVEIQEIVPVSSSGQQSSSHSPRSKPIVGLDRMNIIHMGGVAVCPRLSAYLWAHLFHRMRPFLRNVGRPGECRWAIATKAFSRAIRKRYFKQPPTQSFPFSFCTSASFYGADRDHSHKVSASVAPGLSTVSPIGLGIGFGTGRSSSSMVTQGDLVHKRFDWWHARLAGYFSICTNEDRRAEELPYHLARIQDYGRLSHCLVHFPVFERLSESDNVMDLLRFWRCAGGYSNAVSMYHHALDELEISGASSQEMVNNMQKVALFLHKAGEMDAAQQMLIDAIELEETRLGGRPESMASLTLSMTEILSQSSRQQAQYLEPRQCLEPEYRLLQFASRSVEFHRGLQGTEVERNLALLLMLLSIHLLHYASLGGSAALSSRSALEEAQETAKEAAELYAQLEDHGRLLEAYLHLASTYTSNTPRRALEILEEARKICYVQFGELNDIMLRILLNIALTYETRLSLFDSAEVYYKKWTELMETVYGENHSSTALTREQLADVLAGHGPKDPLDS